MDIFHRLEQAGFVIPDFSQDKEFFPKSVCLKLNGKRLAQNFLSQCQSLLKHKSVIPELAILLVGNHPASSIYVNNKLKSFQQAGFRAHLHHLPENVTQETLQDLVQRLNESPTVHGIIVQLPLPLHIESDKVLKLISPSKDVDGFLPYNLGLLAAGQCEYSLPCTPLGIMVLLAAYGIDCKGKRVLVIGRSRIVGKPLALLLLERHATVTVAHSHTIDLAKECLDADVIIAAVGKPHFISVDCIKDSAVVFDVGIHRGEDGAVVGDVHPGVISKCSAFSPVPGGVGPMTIAMLLVNTALCAWAN